MTPATRPKQKSGWETKGRKEKGEKEAFGGKARLRIVDEKGRQVPADQWRSADSCVSIKEIHRGPQETRKEREGSDQKKDREPTTREPSDEQGKRRARSFSFDQRTCRLLDGSSRPDNWSSPRGNATQGKVRERGELPKKSPMGGRKGVPPSMRAWPASEENLAVIEGPRSQVLCHKVQGGTRGGYPTLKTSGYREKGQGLSRKRNGSFCLEDQTDARKRKRKESARKTTYWSSHLILKPLR